MAIRFYDGTVQFWDVVRRKLLFRWLLDEEQQSNFMIGQIKFTADGGSLLAPITSESRLEVFDLNRCRKQLSDLNLQW